MLTFGSLFAGIGGIDLGLERAGMVCKWQVEIDDYCQRVLAKHWPDVERFGDVKEVHGAVAHADTGFSKVNANKAVQTGRDAVNSRSAGGSPCPSCLPPVDLIAGGFPCQPHSVAGKRRGAEDDRNLWPEFSRIVAELRPRYVLAENVPGIATTYLDTVLSDLESQGYTCATLDIPAVAFDAPHRRHRIFIVAYATSEQDHGRGRGNVVEAPRRRESINTAAGTCGEDVADAERTGFQTRAFEKPKSNTERAQRFEPWGASNENRRWWTVEPDVGRVAHGIPSRVDRLRGLGNAVVPQVAEWIGRRIMEFEQQRMF